MSVEKTLLILLSACCAALCGCHTLPPPPAEAIRVASYNIRLNTPRDVQSSNGWEARKEALVETVRKMNLDVFGMQEVRPEQAAFLREKLPEFVFVGDHRGCDRKTDEASPVFYRPTRFDVEQKGTFWLSETPDVPGSKGWKAHCPRVCSYLVLKDKLTGKRLCFANTHTDHRSSLARANGMRLILERMKTFAKGCPIIFTGDHNCSEIHEPAMLVSRELENAIMTSETPPRGSWRTFNGWRWRDDEITAVDAFKISPVVRNDRGEYFEKCGGARIDYIYVSPGVRVLDYETVNWPRKGLKQYPSDHFPVVATIVLPEGR